MSPETWRKIEERAKASDSVLLRSITVLAMCEECRKLRETLDSVRRIIKGKE